jgi:spore maturation protein CgeB
MKIVIFGLTLSSSWGNGHATLWRGLIAALGRLDHAVAFFERDVPYYAAHRDFTSFPQAQLVLYGNWEEAVCAAHRHLVDADVTIITSYCADADAAAHLAFDAAPNAVHVFYDLDTPITLSRLEAGQPVEYLPREGLHDFDLVLSYTGGAALEAVKKRLGAHRVAALYGHVDPATHRPVAVTDDPRADLSYLGTYALDRQPALERLFIEPARKLPARRFVLGGSGYPPDFPWTPNTWFFQHVSPDRHPAFFCASRLTLNVTRADMAAMGYCPSGRLFEAAACGTPLLSDSWTGLTDFFRPGHEIVIANTTAEALAALEISDAELLRIGRAGRERVLSEHTSARRAEELLTLLEDSACEDTTCGASFPRPEAAHASNHSPSRKSSFPLVTGTTASGPKP